MRLFPRAIVPAAIAAVLFLLSISPASTQDTRATPIAEPDSTNVESRSSLNQPQGTPTISYSISDRIDGLPDEGFFYTISYDFTGYEFGYADEEIYIVLDFRLPETVHGWRAPIWLGANDRVGTHSPTIYNLERAAMMQACRAGEGTAAVEMDVYAYHRNDASNRLYDDVGLQVGIPCTTRVDPVAPAAPFDVCGPNNDAMNIPPQPAGVIVDEGVWTNGQRTVTYSSADWAFFSSGFQTSYTFDDTEECEATASITGPTSLYRLESGSQMEITGNYDVSTLWPGNASLVARIEGSFETERIGQYFGTPVSISGPAGEFSITTSLPGEWLVELCPEYSGNLEINFDLIFFEPDSSGGGIPVWTHEETINVPCTVAVTPLEATINVDVCGYNDQRINVPEQQGIADHSITWDDNVATIAYTALASYEIVGGPFTVTVTADPCVTDPLPEPFLNQVCGVENDEIVIGDIPEGILYDTSEAWVDGIFRIWVSALPGWELPDGTQTEYALVDPGDCMVTPIPPETITDVCGPNNDIISMPVQPEGVIMEDTGWENNSRTISFIPAEGYVFPENTPRYLTSIDHNIACDVDPVGVTVVVTFETSDGESIEGNAYSLYAPVVAQNTGTEPYQEGVIDAGNQILFEELIAGTYRLVTAPEGYEPIDVTIDIGGDVSPQQISIPVTAVQQPEETPTPTPTSTPDVTQTPEPPATPTEKPADPTPTKIVSGLPETGSGSGNSFTLLAIAGLLAAMVLAVISTGRRSGA